MKVMVITPRLGRFTPRTVKFNAHTSYLCSFLASKGLDVIVRDCNWKGSDTILALNEAAALNVDGVVIVCNNTLVYGKRLKRIVDTCSELRQGRKVSTIWLTGYMATSFASEIIEYSPEAAGICDADGIRWIPNGMDQGRKIGELIVQHSLFNNDHPGITGLDMSIEFEPEDRLSLLSSRSCNSKCSFCAYNNGQGVRWKPRSMSAVIRDIEFGLNLFGDRVITFSDNDFLGNRRIAEERIEEFCKGIKGLGVPINYSINTRAECLTPAALRRMSETGLTNITVGLESLHQKTLSNVYHKKVNYQHLLTILDEADRLGITILLSYILWQPFLTVEQLRFEVEQLIRIGRWRVPQLLVNSFVKVVPSTPMERQLEEKGILTYGLFQRGWHFINKDVERIYEDLNQWHINQKRDELENAISNRDTSSLTDVLATRKIEELAFLVDRLNI
ncbi:B12-binding domain-containing radical SAM protein [Laceyella tengchongensis]|jgi:radical SAM superfamily enzyme YgiQ (UPF0313 family)|uniref:B12-binding domain-containing radical SAM protein n=1 Tax=Laceyella tengchongensis TaxID=574699 RepID=UPI0012B7B0F8|nr:radical SAM protein [Laceyella tengchongensis]